MTHRTGTLGKKCETDFPELMLRNILISRVHEISVLFYLRPVNQLKFHQPLTVYVYVYCFDEPHERPPGTAYCIFCIFFFYLIGTGTGGGSVGNFDIRTNTERETQLFFQNVICVSTTRGFGRRGKGIKKKCLEVTDTKPVSNRPPDDRSHCAVRLNR